MEIATVAFGQEQVKQIHERLTTALSLEDPGLVGCRRRAVWGNESASWRWIHGHALLLAAGGTKHGIPTPAGHLECFMLHERWLMQFRGGSWRDYWLEDFFDLWSLAAQYGSFSLSKTVLVFHENRGVLDIKYVTIPDNLNSDARVTKILNERAQNPPGRIPKSGPRALHVCKHCPVKQRCDAADKLRGDNTDWNPQYPTP